EFHYLGLEEARAAAAAAEEAGVAFVCLFACYLRGGIPRFRQEAVSHYLRELEALRADGIAVAVAPHSLPACPPGALRELGPAPGRRWRYGSSAGTRASTGCRSTSTPTSSRARSRSASPRRDCGRSRYSPGRAVSDPWPRSSTPPMRTATSSTCCATPALAF